jgi:phosphate transport system substrate-binding protein
MRISISRRARRVAIGGALVALTTLAACDYGPDGDDDVLTIVGSDTTQDVVDALVTSYDNDLQYNDDPNIPGDDRDDLVNVLSVESGAGEFAPSDEDCPDPAPGAPDGITWRTPPPAIVPPGERLAPNGSTAGREALKAEVLAGGGCVDIARSSAPPRPVGTGAGQDPATFEYYAYALDAVGYSTASAAAPANLTLTQLRNIYNCTITNWNQIPGGPGINQPIERYFAQPGSGTGPFFQNDVLGFDPGLFSGPNCPAVQYVQENQGLSIQANGDLQSGIMNYSGGNWIAMANGSIPDQRAGQVIGNLDGKNITFNTGSTWTPATPQATGDPNAPVQESNVRLVNNPPAYVGVRFVFNVTASNADSYLSALRYIGFDNVADGSTSPLCSGGKASILTLYGFGPLDNTAGPRNIPGSTCRKYVPV